MRTRTICLLAALAAVLTVVCSPAVAAPRPDDVVAHLPRGVYALGAGPDAMWATTVDESSYSTLYRIDPGNNQVTERIALGYPAAGLTLAYGSVWVTDYFGNRLFRYAPDGTIQARIRVGLQPQFVHVSFGSVWTSNHHGHSLSRVDPATNTVVATVQVGARSFRDGPQEIVSSSRYLFVGSSNLDHFQRVDPADNTVTDLAPVAAECCGDLQYAPGTIWDTVPRSLLAYDLSGRLRLTIAADGKDHLASATDLDGRLWYGENTPGGPNRLRAVDDHSGARVTDVVLNGRAGTLAAGFGSIWNLDPGTGEVERITPNPVTT